MCNRLDEVSSIHYGKSPAEVVNSDGLFPIIGTGGEFGRASIPLFNAGVVVPRKGSLGNPQLALTPFWPTDTTFAVLPTEGIDIRWLYYCLLSYDLSRLNEATGVPSISRDWLSKIEFHNPGYKRQKRIAYILQTIDRAIEKTEALINKYQQIKAGLMHDLFTRGIGPNGQLRPPRDQAPELYHETPIGWIPKEWRLYKLAEIAEVIDPQPDHRTPPEQHNGIPYIGIGDFDELEQIDFARCRKVVPEALRKQRLRFTPKRGDIIYGKIGTIGRPKTLDDGEYAVSANVVLIQPFNDSVYLRQALDSNWLESQVLDITNTTSQPALGIEKVRNLVVLMPSDESEIRFISLCLGSAEKKLRTEKKVLAKLKNQKLGLMEGLLSGAVEVEL